VSHHIAVVGGKYQVYRVVNGKYRMDCGPAWADPGTAAKYADLLDDRSPLMGGHDANTDAAPPVAPVDVVPAHERGDSFTGSVSDAGHRRLSCGWKRARRAP
jgi:hypothetical protein